MRYKGVVMRGNQEGRKIGFPTVNLDPSIVPANLKPGIYASLVWSNEKDYKGALYFGPRLVKSETHNVLEIYILDFDREIYGEQIEFEIDRFIRGIKNFLSFEDLKKEMENDIREVKKHL